ncbi:MAG: C-GCAxxG-C-C family protein [Promethearchaeota archaeon]
MNKIEKAISLFSQGHNCAQAVLKAYGTQYGLDGDLAFKITSTLGGGLARSGNTCGAVTGALMALGLRYRNLNVEDKENRELTYETGMNFIKQFRSIYGTIKCKELLGCDISTLEGREKANNNNLFEELCPKFVKSAAEILETVLNMK